ncbi:hypothetical protein ASF71_07060 [Deinococcus sp. Leaf326]|nr:hypothetical protein ASF71_07060 [Deinococcus sp. Leaf326]
MVRTIRATAVSSSMSVGTASEPGRRASSSASRSLERAASATFAPCCVNSSATARPMPEDAPVTSTTLFRISIRVL